MAATQTLKITLDWRSAVADLPPEIQERQTQNLYSALRQLREIEKVERILDPEPPEGSMGAAWLKDLLFTEITPGNLGSLVKTIRHRLPGTPINFEVEVDGQKSRIRIDGCRPEDFDATLAKLVEAAKELSGK